MKNGGLAALLGGRGEGGGGGGEGRGEGKAENNVTVLVHLNTYIAGKFTCKCFCSPIPGSTPQFFFLAPYKKNYSLLFVLQATKAGLEA